MYDIIVIGAGAAGMTSALYSVRSGKTVLVIEGESIGGQIALSPRLENFPSIKQISGNEFAGNLYEQVVALGAEFEFDKVEDIEKVDGYFKIKTEFGSFEAKSVILATGVKHRHIGVDREEDLIGNGVSYCAVCDGAFYAGEDVVLIGDANSALQYAILLSNYCTKVTVCTLFDKFFGEAALVKTLRERKNVEIYHNLALQEFVGDDELSGLVFQNTQTKERFDINTRAVFIAIGQIPNNSAFESIVNLDKAGYIIADEDCKTSTTGIFTAGDCRTKKVRQLTTAVADGAVAAVNACAYVDSL